MFCLIQEQFGENKTSKIDSYQPQPGQILTMTMGSLHGFGQRPNLGLYLLATFCFAFTSFALSQYRKLLNEKNLRIYTFELREAILIEIDV